jgi:dTDP-glucose pyrophosphorylase
MSDFTQFLVSEDATILESMQIINQAGAKFAIVVSKGNVLAGSVTDGDIRRGLIEGKKISDRVSEIMNLHPVAAPAGTTKQELIELLQDKKLTAVPIVSRSGVVTGVESLADLLLIQPRANHVILMAGGLGTRLGDLTTHTPKPMLKVGNKPILELILKNCIEHGFHKFFISVNYKSEAIEEYFGDGSKWNVSIQYLKEQSRLGTAGSLSLYQQSNGLPVVVMNADLLTKIKLTNLMSLHEADANDLTVCVRQYEHQVPYGVISTDNNKVTHVQEKPVYSYYVNGGIYVVSVDLLKSIPKNEVYDMPTFIQDIVNQKRVGFYPILEYWLDIGRRDDFEKAHLEFDEFFKE